jgi:hypothetical protein
MSAVPQRMGTIQYFHRPYELMTFKQYPEKVAKMNNDWEKWAKIMNIKFNKK